jgi:putative membrane protein
VGWTKVKTEKAAMADLESGKYYFVIVIPEDFSAAVASLTGGQPHQAKIAEVTAELNDAVAKLQAVDLPPAQEVATQLQAASGRLNEVNATLSGLVDQGDADAIGEVRAQADALRKDIATLDEGVNQLAGGSDELVDGAAEFAAIIEELSAGAEKLDKGFSTVLGKVPNRTEAQRDSVASALTTPVLLKEKTLNEADTFGTGFAPFFMSLSLFVAVSSSG